LKKCSFGNGTAIKPDGIHSLDPCQYEVIEKYRNVTVEILRCKNCGHVEISWSRQENTEEGDMDG
jgi:hypothetical protein